MPSITTWTRLEPRPRGNDLRPSLEARVHDPAWLLARQWQIGEFRGQDAAFPVTTQYSIESRPVALDGSGPGLQPLEPAAAAEPPGEPTLAERAEQGAELVQLLTEHGCSAASIAALVADYPLPAPDPAAADPQGADFLGLLAGRLPDGAAVREAVASGRLPDAAVGVAAADLPAVRAALADWLDGQARFAVVGLPDRETWRPDRMDYALTASITADSGSVIAHADAWGGDEAEWYEFDLGPSSPTGTGATISTLTGNVPPHPLTYPGMPDHRWWAFEDAYVNLADIDMATSDLGRMLVVEFASVYGNDWYLQPVDLPVGALHIVTELRVTNSMGETTALGPVSPSITALGGAPQGTAAVDWCLFRPAVVTESGAGAGTGRPTLTGLLLPPTVADIQASPPIESVVMVRDEIGDQAWAVESTVLGADSRPLDRFPAAVRDLPPPPPTPADDGSTLHYLLATDVPDIYFALVPDPAGAPTFRLLDRRRVDPDGHVQIIAPAGRLLAEIAASGVRQEEVPLEGAVLARHHYLARGFDGRLLLWTGRRKRLGGTAGSPLLLFDQANPTG